MQPPDPAPAGAAAAAPRTPLVRNVGLLALIATGISSMVGGAINVLPLSIYRTVPELGDRVALAYLFAAVPAVIAAMAYARLAACMPQAGGSYYYLSRGIGRPVAFIVSFGQWVGLSTILGVVAYLLVPFLRDTIAVVDPVTADWLGRSTLARLGLPIAALWLFAWISLRGNRLYAATLVPLTVLMFCCALVVVVCGFSFDHEDYVSAIKAGPSSAALAAVPTQFDLSSLLAASAILFGSYIGFETIAQAGGEARHPQRTLPLAIVLTIAIVAVFYVLFCLAVFHTVPWRHAALLARDTDVTVPGALSLVLPPAWTALILGGVTLALLNHLPAMLLSVSRLLFAWAADGLVPALFGRVHAERGTPTAAIVCCAGVATAAVVGCHLAGDFLFGVDILATSMLINFLMVCGLVLLLEVRSGGRAGTLGYRRGGLWAGVLFAAGVLLLGALLVFHVVRDLSAPEHPWYLRSTWIQLAVMAFAALLLLARPRRR